MFPLYSYNALSLIILIQPIRGPSTGHMHLVLQKCNSCRDPEINMVNLAFCYSISTAMGTRCFLAFFRFAMVMSWTLSLVILYSFTPILAVRHQAITWANIDRDLCRHMELLCKDESSKPWRDVKIPMDNIFPYTGSLGITDPGFMLPFITTGFNASVISQRPILSTVNRHGLSYIWGSTVNLVGQSVGLQLDPLQWRHNEGDGVSNHRP